MDQDKILTNNYYQSLIRKLIFTVIIVSFAPMILVSDVFLGLRGLPHFIVAVRQIHEGKPWIFRATIDFGH